mmetsp:Transcript_141539/g.394425  ORF Transcript_141539/g.394425 Transcript_141539/m.394425 type:complete len:395 (+) Transcript_141539:155-1339(+)|eukprot:CAMPEP_0179079416 /NCGR_PEP_ID=MMETSP0796-20121207/35631_1 /TAXON_ID=73915 /ORGANISM="Pyrodinium bahamense, Strain pbaha01" /LENGTH=394 /DNA_ID=CAMNT_0020776751 /DNA_START=77 /DNA_END=1261 /DNA_ORIENTATION=-
MSSPHVEDTAPSVAPENRRQVAASGKGSADCGAAGDEDCNGDPHGEEHDREDGEEHGGDGPEGEEDGDPDVPDDAEEWEAVYACPLNIRFTQDKIHPFFYRRGPIVNVVPKIRLVMHSHGDPPAGGDVLELVPPFDPIHCLRKGSELWSLDNRRLYALQLAAMEQWPQQCRVRLLCRDKLPRHKFKTQYRKFNTTSEGQAIDVCAKYQQFDTWNWLEQAVEIELYTFSTRLGTLFSTFEVIPVVGALLFRTGMTGFGSRAPFIAAFLLASAVDLLRQKMPVFERKICELHVRAVMEGDVQHVGSCCRRFRGRTDEASTPSSAAQLAASMAVALVLLLPYVLGIAYERLRSSLLSCWLGVACVLVTQLGSALRDGGGSLGRRHGGQLSPKHRGCS